MSWPPGCLSRNGVKSYSRPCTFHRCDGTLASSTGAFARARVATDDDDDDAAFLSVAVLTGCAAESRAGDLERGPGMMRGGGATKRRGERERRREVSARKKMGGERRAGGRE